MNESTQTSSGIIPFCEQRAATYRLLASLYDREIKQETSELLVSMGSFEKDPSMLECEVLAARGFQTMISDLKGFTQDKENELACDFAHIFLASGIYDGKAAVPYESIYTSEEGILMQDARDEVRALFREAHVMPDTQGTVPEDYIVFELEYMALLNERMVEAVEGNDREQVKTLAEKQSNFLQNHLINWVPELITDIRRVGTTPFYQGLADATQGFLECEEVDIEALVDSCKTLAVA